MSQLYQLFFKFYPADIMIIVMVMVMFMVVVSIMIINIVIIMVVILIIVLIIVGIVNVIKIVIIEASHSFLLSGNLNPLTTRHDHNSQP